MALSEAAITKSEMADGATVAQDGERTISSAILKTTMATPASTAKVLAFYKNLLEPGKECNNLLRVDSTEGKSILIRETSPGRPVEIHTIVVNTQNSSTTLVISRLEAEEQTTIEWTQYLRHSTTQKETPDPTAKANLINGHQLRLWVRPNFFSSARPEDLDGQMKTIISPPKIGRSLFAEVRTAEGELVFGLREMDVSFKGPANNVEVAYSEDRNLAAIYSPTNRDMLILADLKSQTFASPMTIWAADDEAIRTGPPRGFSDRRPGPVRIHWQDILDEIRSANPDVNVDWNCL
ncbi:MAG: hypothetical protein ACE361_15985 [Aureliella sp.]